jgi:hypothetical protein
MTADSTVQDDFLPAPLSDAPSSAMGRSLQNHDRTSLDSFLPPSPVSSNQAQGQDLRMQLMGAMSSAPAELGPGLQPPADEFADLDSGDKATTFEEDLQDFQSATAGMTETLDWTQFLDLYRDPFDFDDMFSIPGLTPGLFDAGNTGFLFNQTQATAAPTSRKQDAYFRFESHTDVNLSRPASPRTLQAKERWFSQSQLPGQSMPVVEDRAMIDELIWSFYDNVAPSFALFRDQHVRITPATGKESWLLMAAVGALFCHTEGASQVAKWLYHNGRQYLLSRVCSPIIASTVRVLTPTPGKQSSG